jgi:Fur family transcriptional regulator, iron response regulator
MDDPDRLLNSETDASAVADLTLDELNAEGLGRSVVADKLRAAGIPLTLQRLVVGQVMLAAPAHLSAEQVLVRVRRLLPEVSRATVYNTLNLFVEKKLLRELVVDAQRIVFDSNTTAHYHLYDVGSGELSDIPADELKVVGSATLAPGLELEAVDVVIRVRRKASEAAC